jgi:hypothetical protein
VNRACIVVPAVASNRKTAWRNLEVKTIPVKLRAWASAQKDFVSPQYYGDSIEVHGIGTIRGRSDAKSRAAVTRWHSKRRKITVVILG